MLKSFGNHHQNKKMSRLRINTVKDLPVIHYMNPEHWRIKCFHQGSCWTVLLIFQLVESEEQFQQSLADALVLETAFTVNVWVNQTCHNAEVCTSAKNIIYSSVNGIKMVYTFFYIYSFVFQ